MTSSSSEQTAQSLWKPTQGTSAPSTTRRVGVACASCRSRKVKCNRNGDEPCTNCVFENLHCYLLPKQRRHRKARPSRKQRQPGSSVLDLTAQATDPAHNQTQPETSVLHESPDPNSRISDSQPYTDINDDIDWSKAVASAVPMREPSPFISLLHEPASSAEESETFATPSVPSFLTPPPHGLKEQDLDYLHRKAALTVPESELRDALIQSYVLYIHPCYPIIDLYDLEEAILGNSTFSLSVYQAMMFAASSWVDIKLLRKLGYLSRWAARRALYTKARLLYDTDYEQDGMCQLQTLVLLSLWWKGPGESKDGWHWLGLAINVALTMGLHRDATNKSFSAKTCALRRRMWWSIVIRDTFTSFSCNRVPRISDADSAVSPLTLHDFEWDQLRVSGFHGAGEKSMERRKQVASVCIHTATICRAITRVLFASQNDASINIDFLYPTSLSNKRKTNMRTAILRDIEEDFQAWQNDIPPDVLHNGSILLPNPREEQALLVHRAFLSILCHTGTIMIYRQKDGSLEGDKSSRNEVREAARQVNKIVMDMFVSDLMKEMPPTVVSLLFPVSMSHIADMKSQDSALRREGERRLEECKQALRELSDGHVAAEWTVNLLEHIQSKAKAQHPLAGVPSSSSPEQTLLENSNGGRIHDTTSICEQPSAMKGNDGELALTDDMQYVEPSSFLDRLGATDVGSSFDWMNSPASWLGFPDATWDMAITA